MTNENNSGRCLPVELPSSNVCKIILNRSGVCLCTTEEERKKTRKQKGNNNLTYPERKGRECTWESANEFVHHFHCPCLAKGKGNCPTKIARLEDATNVVLDLRLKRFEAGGGGGSDALWSAKTKMPWRVTGVLMPEISCLSGEWVLRLVLLKKTQQQ